MIEINFNPTLDSLSTEVRETPQTVSIPAKQSPHSLIEIIQGSNIPAGCTIMIMSESGSQVLKITNKFFLSGMGVSYRERVQLTETFGAANVAFFDDSVKVYQFSGQAID